MTPETALWVTAIAAAVQAAAAIVIIILTIRLAKTARDALAEATRQAKASEESLRAADEALQQAQQATLETRKQRLAAAVPILDLSVSVSKPNLDGVPHGMFLVKNPGPNAAIDVRVLLYGMTSDRRAEEQERCHSRPIALLAAGEERGASIRMLEFQNVPGPRPLPRPEPEPMFSNDWIRVVVYCQGLQGARTSLRYSWWANGDGRLELEEVKIIPDPERAQWQIVLETEQLGR